jgi:hypothetical protein
VIGKNENGMTKKFLLLCTVVLLAQCSEKKEARYIVDRCIEVHGGERYDHARISFDFRGRHYELKRQGGLYTYTRSFSDSLGTYVDVLSNTGFQRFLNDSLVSLSDEWKGRYTSSINSVAYFALLPKPLNDPAAQKVLIGEELLSGDHYYKIKVTFAEEGGGADHDDVFMYWIHQETFTMDYFAYAYTSEGGGMRFREAVNARMVNGIRVSDYKNYRPKTDSVPIDQMGALFSEGALELFSEIINENVSVEIM